MTMNSARTSIAEARDHARETVERSGTSFAAGMRILSKPRREAMHAIYAFCREVDDIADGDLPVAEKRVALAAWRAEIDALFAGSPQTATGLALLEPVRQFDLPRKEFIMMIEGMEMDAEGPIIAPSVETLLAYTRRVAGAVGLLSMPAFGAPKSRDGDEFALALGDALQLTNIIRDVGEDAAIGRLYLPRELLAKHNAPMNPEEIVGSSGLPGVAEELASVAKERFSVARERLTRLDWKVLRPALLMMGVYEAYLKKLEARGWDRVGEDLSMSKVEKALIAVRYFFAPPLRKAA